MGHKWMWNAALGGLPPEEFLVEVDPLLAGVREKLAGRVRYVRPDRGQAVARNGRKAGSARRHPDSGGRLRCALGRDRRGLREGDVVNVVGTSTCIMAIAKQADLIPGVCGVVKGSIHPDYYGIEAGLVGDGRHFRAPLRGARVPRWRNFRRDWRLSRAGQTGLLRLTWDNGDRTVLVNAELGGVTLGWNLGTTAQDELFAAIEGTAFHTRVDSRAHGGAWRASRARDQWRRHSAEERDAEPVYANVLEQAGAGAEQEVTSLGSAIFAFLAAGAFQTIEEAQAALCPSFRVVEPDAREAAVYEELFALYRALYFGLGQPGSSAVELGSILPKLREVRAAASNS